MATNLVAMEAAAGGNLGLSEAWESSMGGVVNFSSVRINSNEVPAEVGAPGKVDVDVNGGPTGVRAVRAGFWVPGDGTPIVVS